MFELCHLSPLLQQLFLNPNLKELATTALCALLAGPLTKMVVALQHLLGTS